MAVSTQRSKSTTTPPPGEIRVTWNAKYKPHLCCAEDTLIPVLSGVFVSPNRLAAANGFILVSVPCTVEGAPSDWKGAIIPRDLFGLKQPTSTGTITVTDTSASTYAVLAGGLVAKVSVNLIDGDFPNYQSVFDKAIKGTNFEPTSQIAFDLSLMSRVEKAMGEKNGMRVLPTTGGAGAEGPLICVPYGDRDAIGLVMPMRSVGTSSDGFSADELLKRLTVPS